MAQRVNNSHFTGVCKFWNAVKGYGFLTADDGGPDLFVSQHDLVTGDSGFRALVASQRVECTYTFADGKAIAKNVTGPNGAQLRSFKDMYTAKRQIETAKPPDPSKNFGTIKWFNAGKQFGFIIPQGGGDDVFFHFSECLKGVVPNEGDQVEYGVTEDKHGKTIGCKIKNKTQKRASNNPMVAGGSNPMQQMAGGAMGAMGAMNAMATTYNPQFLPPAAFPSFGRKSGVVKFFDEAKGYGFIIPDTGGRDIHVHKSNVMGGELEKDEAVEYEEQAISGKVQAVNVSRTQNSKRGGDQSQAAYATKRPRVVYDMPQQQQQPAQGAYGNDYQYFDPSAISSGAPRYY